MQDTTHSSSKSTTQQIMFRSCWAFILACCTTTWTTRTAAIKKEPKHTLPNEDVIEARRLFRNAVPWSLLKYQRPKTPQ